MSQLATELADLRICAYRDDETLLGSSETLAPGLTQIEAFARGVGLIIEPAKRRFLPPSDVLTASLSRRSPTFWPS